LAAVAVNWPCTECGFSAGMVVEPKRNYFCFSAIAAVRAFVYEVCIAA
jgi:hypothetical protein